MHDQSNKYKIFNWQNYTIKIPDEERKKKDNIEKHTCRMEWLNCDNIESVFFREL